MTNKNRHISSLSCQASVDTKVLSSIQSFRCGGRLGGKRLVLIPKLRSTAKLQRANLANTPSRSSDVKCKLTQIDCMSGARL